MFLILSWSVSVPVFRVAFFSFSRKKNSQTLGCIQESKFLFYKHFHLPSGVLMLWMDGNKWSIVSWLTIADSSLRTLRYPQIVVCKMQWVLAPRLLHLSLYHLWVNFLESVKVHRFIIYKYWLWLRATLIKLALKDKILPYTKKRNLHFCCELASIICWTKTQSTCIL